MQKQLYEPAERAGRHRRSDTVGVPGHAARGVVLHAFLPAHEQADEKVSESSSFQPIDTTEHRPPTMISTEKILDRRRSRRKWRNKLDTFSQDLTPKA